MERDERQLRVSSRTAEVPFLGDLRVRSGRTDRRGEARCDTREEQVRSDPARPDRLLEVRRRIASRYYETPGIAEEVARRILERGDL